MSFRNWCFTLNNPEHIPISFPLNSQSKIKLCIYQLEEVQCRHLQGYIEFNSPVRITFLKKLIPRAHFEHRKGSRIQAIDYCRKEESRIDGPWIFPQGAKLPNPGGSTHSSSGGSSLQDLKNLLDEGYSEEYIADEHFSQWVRHYRAFRAYKLIKTKPRNHEVRVIVIVGPTGTGKSRYCLSKFPKAYWKQRSTWWDGYNAESTVVLDEFYGWLPYDTLLRLCDRYPMLVETKGGQTHMLCDQVVITSNHFPDTWYKNIYFESFKRRVQQWIIYNHDGFFIFTDFNKFKEYHHPRPLLGSL